MRVLVTGAGGYVGGALVRRLLTEGQVAGRPLTQVLATDLRLDGLHSDARLQAVAGDLSQAITQDALFSAPLDVVCLVSCGVATGAFSEISTMA